MEAHVHQRVNVLEEIAYTPYAAPIHTYQMMDFATLEKHAAIAPQIAANVMARVVAPPMNAQTISVSTADALHKVTE